MEAGNDEKKQHTFYKIIMANFFDDRESDLVDEIRRLSAKLKKVDNISQIILETAQDRDYEFCLLMMVVDKIRKKYSSYIWAYPITYHDDKGKIYKQTFGWDIEFMDCTIKQYNQEQENYHDALKQAVEVFNKTISENE